MCAKVNQSEKFHQKYIKEELVWSSAWSFCHFTEEHNFDDKN